VFRQWKKAVGLPEEFPKLKPLNDDDLEPAKKFYIGLAQREVIEEILDRALAPRVAVTVACGRGCSTLCAYVYKETRRNSVRRRLIPVRFNLDDLDDIDTSKFNIAGNQHPPPPLEILEATMRREIVRCLVNDPWERVLGNRPYAALIGAVGSPYNSFQEHLMMLRAAVGHVGDVLSWDEIRRLSDKLGLAVDSLLAELSQTYQVRVSLQIDFSSRVLYEDKTRYSRLVGNLIRAIKRLHELDGRKPKPTLPAVLYEMYFASPEMYDNIFGDWQVPRDLVEFPVYRKADVYAILSYHYPPQGVQGNPRSEALSAVIDSTLLAMSVDKKQSLDDIVDDFEKTLHYLMDNWEGVSYHLKMEDFTKKQQRDKQDGPGISEDSSHEPNS
jgi:hypothetical protein